MDVNVPELLPNQVTSALETNASLLSTNTALLEDNAVLIERNRDLVQRNRALEERVASLELFIQNLPACSQLGGRRALDPPSQETYPRPGASPALVSSERHHEHADQRSSGFIQPTTNLCEGSQEGTVDGTEDATLLDIESETESEGQHAIGSALSRSITLGPSTPSSSSSSIETSDDVMTGRLPEEPLYQLPGSTVDPQGKHSQREGESPEFLWNSQELP